MMNISESSAKKLTPAQNVPLSGDWRPSNHVFWLACTALLIGMVLVANSRPVGAQPAEDEITADDAEAAAAPGKDDDPLGLRVERPIVAAIREADPQDPAKLIIAIDQLLELGEQTLAEEYANRLVGLNLNDQALVDTGLKVGPVPLLRLSTGRALTAESRQLMRRMLDAVREFRRDANRLAELADQAAQSSGSVRRHAIADLRAAGPTSVQPLIRLLAKRDKPQTHVYLRDALAQLGEQAIDPLLAVLQSKDDHLQQQVLLTLARMRAGPAIYDVMCRVAMPAGSAGYRDAANRAAIALLDRIPTTHSVKHSVYRVVHDYLTGQRTLPADIDDNSVVWYWQDDKHELIRLSVPRHHAAAATAVRLAGQLYDVDRNDTRLARLSALAQLNWTKLHKGLDQGLHQPTANRVQRLARDDSAEFIEDVLALALRRKITPAAIGAVEMIAAEANKAANGIPALLNHSGPSPTPLAQCLSHPDRRLRFAALEAAIAARPETLFAGASGIPSGLKFFLNTGRLPRAIIADPRPARAQLLSALLTEIGWESDIFYTGQAMACAAARRADYAVAFVALTVDHHDSCETLATLHDDVRTADLPVGLIIEAHDRPIAERVTDRFALTEAFLVPRDALTAQERLTRLVILAGDRFVPHERRVKNAARAAELFVTLSDRQAGLFEWSGLEEILELSLYNPSFSEPVARALGNLRSPAAQRALANAATAVTAPIALRRHAAAAFATNVQKHGIGLTIVEIQRLAKFYDQQADTGPETEEVMWSLLDTLQSVTK